MYFPRFFTVIKKDFSKSSLKFFTMNNLDSVNALTSVIVEYCIYLAL